MTADADVEREYRRRLDLPRGAGPVDRVAVWDRVWCETCSETPEDGRTLAKAEIGEGDMPEELPLLLEPFSRR